MKLRDRIIKSVRGRQRVWAGGRLKTVGASEVFGCIRKAWYAKHKPELENQDNKNWGILERGNIIENLFAVPTLRDIFGEQNCLYMGEDQETFVDGKASATPDGLLINQPRDIFADDGLPDIGPSQSVGAEVKSFDVRANLYAAKTIHDGQAIMQLGMFRRKSAHKPDYSMLLYINSGDLTDLRPFPVTYNEGTYQAGLARAGRVYLATDAYELPAEGVHTDQCKFCPFVDTCRKTEIDRFPSHVSNYTSNEIAAARSYALEYDKASKDEKEAEKRKSEVGENIRRFLADVGTKGIEDADFKLTYSLMPNGKEALDKEALDEFLKQHGTSVEDFMVGGKPYTRLTVTVRNNGK